jgi:hypothetical protein
VSPTSPTRPRTVHAALADLRAMAGGLVIFGTMAVASPSPVVGQSHAPGIATEGAWNAPRVLELVDRARALRQSQTVDPDFRTYTAQARGYVYFFVDRPDSASQVLVKADQVALDLQWRAPGATRQTIVGLRDEKVLPTNIRYHLDHLTVIQDDFGDRIRLGDGDEVAAVVHPAGPASESLYDFLLSDSLTISYAGGTEEVRVYEVRVRPKRMDQPGFVGSIYLDLDRAAIVRMSFSFTPSSYVDPYLDYIRISLDNALWMGSRWLPYRQEIEIRREMPLFDFLAGSIIRGKFDIRGYDFNVDLPDGVFSGRSVRSLPVAEREAFLFERGLFDDIEETGGLEPSPTLEAVRTQVRKVVEDRVMSGLAPVRVHGARISDFARYDRAEGIFMGAGVAFRPIAELSVRTTAGYAFGRERASGGVTLSADRRSEAWTPVVDAYWDALGDIGGRPGSTLLENTISSAAGSRDDLDPYFRRGAAIRFLRSGERDLDVTLRFEEHRGAVDVVSDGPDTGFRPVRSIDEGRSLSLVVRHELPLPWAGRAALTATAGRLGERSFASIEGDAAWAFADARERWAGEVSLAAGLTNPGAPAQNAYLLGGRHTLMGHGYRLFAGNAYWLARLETTVPVHRPWLGVRAFASAGSTYLRGMGLPPDWLARDTRGLRGTVGLGLSVGWDAMRFDVGRAVWGTGWEAMFSVAPRFRAWL